MNKRYIIISVFLIVILTFITFYPSLQNGFTNWDDDLLVTKNLKIMNLSLKNIEIIFTTPHYGLYHPLVLLSYAFEYYFLKLDPRAYHATNLTLHLLNSLFVFWFIYLLRRNILVSFIVGLLFGIHPLHVESVAWVTERKDELYAFFFLISLIFYLYYIKKRERSYYYLSLLSFIFSLLSKSMAMTLPIVLFLCDYQFVRRFERKTIIEKIPFLIISFIFGIIAVLAQYKSKETVQEDTFNLFYNFLKASYGLIFYFYKMIIPINLSCIYPSFDKIHNLSQATFLLSPILVAGLIVAIIFSAKHNRIVTFGSLFFLVTISPVLQFLPVGLGNHADRYTYIPSIGFFYILGEGVAHLLGEKVKNKKDLRTFFIIIFTGITLFFSFLSYQRCKVWRDSLTLWNDVLKQYPDIALAHLNRGIAYGERGEYNEALADFSAALRINPQYAEAFFNCGNIYYERKDFDRALYDFSEAIRINPNYVKAYNNRGNLFKSCGNFEKALADYSQAINIDPNYEKPYYNRALLYISRGETKKAEEDFKKLGELGYRVNPKTFEILK